MCVGGYAVDEKGRADEEDMTGLTVLCRCGSCGEEVGPQAL